MGKDVGDYSIMTTYDLRYPFCEREVPWSMTGGTGCHHVVRWEASKLIDGTPDRISWVWVCMMHGDG